MKKIVLLLLFAFIFVFSIHSSYSPWASFSTGIDTIFYFDSTWPAFSYGIEVSLASFSWDKWTLSMPMKIEGITTSIEKNGVMTMEHNKLKCGLGGEYRNKLLFLSMYLYLGIIDYRDIGGVGKEYSVTFTPGLQIEDHFAVLFPISYNHSSYYPSVNFQVALKMGGKI